MKQLPRWLQHSQWAEEAFFSGQVHSSLPFIPATGHKSSAIKMGYSGQWHSPRGFFQCVEQCLNQIIVLNLFLLRCSFNAQTTIPRPLLFSRRRFLVTVANVTLRNADFYKVNRSRLIWRIRYEERFQRTDHVSSNKRITSRLFVTTIFASAVDLNF